MNHIRWAAWGVINIEALDRMQRRNYIKRTRAELAKKGITLSSGGSKSVPWYSISLPRAEGAPPEKKADKGVAGGEGAFRNVCVWLLKELGDHVSSEDGGVRNIGAEAQGG
jgi:hypothetical protein